MISKKSSSECFVYITLPRETTSVTAGRFVLTVDRTGIPLGQFVYGRRYLASKNAIEIDPVELKLASRTYDTTRLGGVFGALRDASPDHWGRRIIEKHSEKTQLGELDYLLLSPDDRAGAIGFGIGKEPPAPKRKFNQTIQLATLQRVAHELLQEEIREPDHTAVQIQELTMIGTSLGGGRPKAVVEDDIGLWVAKFSRPDDRWNNPRVEYAMLELARKCGIHVARSRIETVGKNEVLLVHRFDRERTSLGYSRARMISGLTLLRADEIQQPSKPWSYISMAEELRRIVAEPKKDAAELFRRMCFNALISNLDDHPRNHALIAMDREWKLSPAYDLTPSPVISHDQRDLAMVCGDNGRFANAKNLLTQSSRFLLNKQEAESIVSEMTDQIRTTWYSVIRSAGVSEKDAATIKGAFVYEGFNY